MDCAPPTEADAPVLLTPVERNDAEALSRLDGLDGWTLNIPLSLKLELAFCDCNKQQAVQNKQSGVLK